MDSQALLSDATPGPRGATSRRRRFMMAFAAAILLPALAASLVVWQTLTEQIYAGYAQRLDADLEIYSLVLANRHRELLGAAARIAADNTVQITMELEIVPQLLRYLQTQSDVAGLDFLFAVRPDGRRLVGIGVPDGPWPDEQACRQTDSRPEGTALWSADGFYLVRVLPVHKNQRLLGSICAGLRLDEPAFIQQLHHTLGGLPLLWWQNRRIPLPGSGATDVPAGWETRRMFDQIHAGNAYKGMVDDIRLGSVALKIGILMPLTALHQGFGRALLAVAAVLGLIGLIAVVAWRHLSKRTEAEQRLLQEEARARTTLASLGDGVVTTDHQGRINFLNAAAERITGHRLDEARGQPWDAILRLRNEHTGQAVPDPVRETRRAGHTVHAPVGTVLLRAGGGCTAVHYSAAAIPDGGRNQDGVVLVLRDVSRERGLQSMLAWKASRDDLTGLINRTEFRTRVEEAMALARERGSVHALLYLDLDQFKVVNDSCGHQAGDELLKQLTALLKTRMRVSDTLARLGGDEFGALLMDCPPDQAMRIADGLLEGVREHRFFYGDKVFQVGVSIGMTTIDADSPELDNLMSAVDAACYTAKDQGRNCIHLTREDGGETDRRIREMQWVPRIRHALQENRFVLYCQPIVSLEGDGADGPAHGEILIRMLDETGGLVAPGAFLPVAERYDLISDIDRWSIHILFTQYKPYFQAAGPGDGFPFSINLSGSSLANATFLDFVKAELRAQAIPPRLVAFEITETTAIRHMDRAIQFITELRSMGCRFLLDDFGSGMSSFGYLKYLHVDYLKIDGLFVKGIVDDPIDRVMVEAINRIGHSLGLLTVAEYVENEAILAELKVIGVDYAQGYGIARPAPLPLPVQTRVGSA